LRKKRRRKEELVDRGASSEEMRAFFFIPVAKLRNSSVQEFSVTGEEIFFPR
jgi:hypothetical protein